MHPDFLHPRKRYSQEFVDAVLAKVLGSGKGICATGRTFSLHYQTIQKWISGFSLGREAKAICFSGYGKLDRFIKFSVWDYAQNLWKVLRKAFAGEPGGILTSATRLIWEGYGCPLY